MATRLYKLATIFFWVLALTSLCSCEKGYWQWNLSRDNPDDARADIDFVPLVYLNCESLLNVTREKYYFQQTQDWAVSTGYENNGWVASNCQGGFVEFDVNLTERAILTFWTKTVNPGYSNEIPVVTIDNEIYELEQFEGTENSDDWIRLKTLSVMPGNHVVKIDFTVGNSLVSYYLDEIIFYK